jgi:hypothetical protein
MDRERITYCPHQFGIESGHSRAFVGPDGGKYEWSKRFYRHSDLDLLPSANLIHLVGRDGVHPMHGIEDQAAALHQREEEQQGDCR